MEANNNGGASSDAGVDRPAWMDSLPDAHKQNQSFMSFKEPSEAWNKFDSLLKAEGKAVVIPEDGATDEVKKAFYSKLGVPDKADDYEFDKADIAQYTAEADKAFREVMLKANMSKGNAKIVHKAFMDSIKAGVEAQKKAADEQAKAEQKAFEESVNALKDEWKGDEFKANTELAARTFRKFGGDKAVEFIDTAKIGNIKIGDHPMFIRIFAGIGKAITNDSAVIDRSASGGGDAGRVESAKKMFPNTQFNS